MNSDEQLQLSINGSTVIQVLAHLHACDRCFIPPLNTRVNLLAYAEKIAFRATRFEVWIGGELSALLACYTNDLARTNAFITSVSVIPAAQGQGVADALLTAAINYVRDQRFEQIELEVASDNVAARNLYIKAGFFMVSEHNGTETMRLALQEKFENGNL